MTPAQIAAAVVVGICLLAMAFYPDRKPLDGQAETDHLGNEIE